MPRQLALARIAGRICSIAALLALASCKKASKESPAPITSRAATKSALASTPGARKSDRYELAAHLDGCQVYHRGILLDLGTPGVQARRRFSITAPDTASVVDREGASFERVQSANLWFDVWVEQPIQKPTIILRVHGGAARYLHLAVDDIRLGALRVPSDETRVLASAAGNTALGRGRHRIVLRFAGAPRATKSALAEIDWIKLGEPEPEPARYAAPTLEDIVDDVALDKVPKRSLVLRAPTHVRCWLRPSADARLKLSAGLLGAGKGVAQVSLIRDGEPPVVLQTRRVAGGDGATWTPIALDLGAYASSLVGLDFAALEATRGGRVAFGDPVIVRRDEAAPEPPRARVAVVVVMASSERARIPPWGPTGALKTWGALARAGTSWSAHRAPSSVTAAVVATLLTGRSPAAHGLVDVSSRLAPELPVISEIVKEASGRTAMFTGVPTTFAPFGFDQGWDLYDPVSPVKDLPAAEPIIRATRWLEQAIDEGNGTPILAVIHARGAHPPWDLSREEAQLLKPTDYSGAIDPRRGGIIIGALRGRRHRIKRLSEEDWARLHALGDASLAKQDAALGELVTSLKRHGAWDQTLLVLTGDVAPGEPPDFPFDPKGPLNEDRLLVPLLIKWPGGSLAGKELLVPSSFEDLTVTVLDALGLRIPRGASGLDLYARALGRDPLVARAQVASLADRYSSRLGAWLLRGQIGAPPTLCALDVDPACASDVAERELSATRALWQATFHALSEAQRLVPAETSRRPLITDPDTSAALVVWGDQY